LYCNRPLHPGVIFDLAHPLDDKSQTPWPACRGCNRSYAARITLPRRKAEKRRFSRHWTEDSDRPRKTITRPSPARPEAPDGLTSPPPFRDTQDSIPTPHHPQQMPLPVLFYDSGTGYSFTDPNL
jgi:hypothetical protein